MKDTLVDWLLSWLPQTKNVPDYLISRGSQELSIVYPLFSLSIGLFAFFLFCLLRLLWPCIYSARARLKNSDIPCKFPNTFFGWIKPLYLLNQEIILKNIGLDAVMFLVFFKNSAKLFAALSLYGLIVIIPVNLANSKGKETSSIFRSNENKNSMIAHVIGIYYFSLATYYMLFETFNFYVKHRRQFILNAKDSVAARSIIVQNIPSELRDQSQLKRFYAELALGRIQSAYMCIEAHSLTKLVRQRFHYLQKLERSIVKWAGNPAKFEIPNFSTSTSTISLSRSAESLRQSSTVLPVSSSSADALPKRPRHRSGWFGLFGSSHDSIDYYARKFRAMDHLIAKDRASYTFSYTDVGFVTFHSIASAHILSQLDNTSKIFRCKADLSPEPRDIYWDNVGLSSISLFIRYAIAYAMYFVLLMFWGVPMYAISITATTNHDPFAKSSTQQSFNLEDFFSNVLRGYLPIILVVSFMSFVPFLMYGMSIFQGNKTYSGIEFATFKKHFVFLVLNVLLVFTVSGSAWNTVVKEVVNNPINVTSLLAQSLPDVAPFFLNYVIFLGIASFPIELLQISSAFRYFLRHVSCNTPREYANAFAPVYVNYGWLYGTPILVFVIALTYSTVFPLILVAASIYFVLGYYCYKYLFVCVYFRSFETCGRAWPSVFICAISGLFFLQLMMIGYFVAQDCNMMATCVLALIPSTIGFMVFTYKAFPNQGKYLPMDMLRDEMGSTTWMDPQPSPPFSIQSMPTPIMKKEQTISVEFADDDTSSAKNATGIEVSSISKAYPYRQEDEDQVGSTRNTTLVSRRRNPKKQVNYMQDDEHVAHADIHTDYSQSPMYRFLGILDSSLVNYGHPAIYGKLPTLWLPLQNLPSNPLNIHRRFYSYDHWNLYDSDDTRRLLY